MERERVKGREKGGREGGRGKGGERERQGGGGRERKREEKERREREERILHNASLVTTKCSLKMYVYR